MHRKTTIKIVPQLTSFARVIYNHHITAASLSLLPSAFLGTTSPSTTPSLLSSSQKEQKISHLSVLNAKKTPSIRSKYQRFLSPLTNTYTQMRFYKRETSLNKNDDLTKEELKVLEELEREEKAIKEKQANRPTFESDDKGSQSKQGLHLSQSVSQDFVPFEDQQRIIQDVIEEIWNPLPEPQHQVYQPPEEFLRRGKSGVFDLGELVDLIRAENGTEVVAISLPKELDYADHMVIVTAKSQRHLIALGHYVRKRFKMKKLKRTDVLPTIVSEDSKQGWIALDLGNIILHIFLEKQRDFYDLEMLWTVGPTFDDLCNAKDPEIIQLLNLMK